jgi:hypothetical protein
MRNRYGASQVIFNILLAVYEKKYAYKQSNINSYFGKLQAINLASQANYLIVWKWNQ